MFERFTDRARRVVVLAQAEARLLNHNHVGTEHLLLGIIREGQGAATAAIESLGISLESVRQQVEENIGGGASAPAGPIAFTPRARKVLKRSQREAQQLGQHYLGPEHILLSLIREGNSLAAQVLVRLGADANRVRQQVINYQGTQPAAGGGTQSPASARAGGVFERFTDRARRVVVLAQEEARSLNHNRIGTEHLLLGLVREGESAAAVALQSLGIRLDAVRGQVEEILGRGQQPPSGHLPFTPRSRIVLEHALREARQLDHDYVGPEHILLSLIREGEGVAAQILLRLGADLNQVRQRVLELLPGGPPAQADARAPSNGGDPGFAELEILGIRTGQRPAAPGGRLLDEPDGHYANSSEDQPFLLLKEKPGDRFVPIWIDPVVAMAIAFAQQGVISRRPLTHDLMRDILAAMEIQLLSVNFAAHRDGVVYADLNFSDGSTVSSRPSDATALALRMGAPLYMATEILLEAGVAIPSGPLQPLPPSAASEQPADSAGPPPEVITGLSPADTAVPLEVVDVRVEPSTNRPVLLTKEKSGDRYLPIWIGPTEATAIALAQREESFARPQTHDLMRDILEAVGMRMISATLIALRDEIFFTDLSFSDGSMVSSRPSDAVSMVLRTGATLLVSGELLGEAGVTIPDEKAESAQ
jgi:bifunctional DNase/RNase